MKFILLTALLSVSLLTGCRGVTGSPSTGAAISAPTVPAAAPASVAEAEAKIKAAEEALRKAKAEKEALVIAGRKRKCNWIMAGLGTLAVLLAAGAYFLPLARGTLAGASFLAAGCIPAVLFIKSLAAYWEWIGAGFLLLVVVFLIYGWLREHRTLSQTVKAVENVKAMDPVSWTKIKDRFSESMTDGPKGIIKRLIGRLGA